MKPNLIIFLFCTLILAGAAYCDDAEVVSSLDHFGQTLDQNKIEQRTRILMRLHLPAQKEVNPTFLDLIRRVNEQLRKQHAPFQIVIHVDNASEKWWQFAKKMTLSESLKMKDVDANKLQTYLRSASAWDIITDVGETAGFSNPIYFNRAIVISASVSGSDELQRTPLE